MFKLFLHSLWQYFHLIVTTFIPRKGQPLPSWRRVGVMLVFVPLFGLVQMIHWIGFWLDELFYRDYRKVSIKKPVFVLGVPRSGTTFLHRVLSDEPGFTTFSTWECFFAPSITQRKFWLFLGRLDAKIGHPLSRLLGWIETRLLSGLDGIHATRMNAAEEDYLALMPVLASFILILPFPQSQEIWQMGSFDRDMPETRKKQLMQFYKKCLQKHLYVQGTQKTLLSKNAAFASLSGSLCETFPDARFLCCLRDPMEALPSQLSSIQAGIKFFDAESQGPVFTRKMLDLFPYYYTHLLETLPKSAADRHGFIEMNALQSDLYKTISFQLQKLGISMSDAFDQKLREHDEKARKYVTRHKYTVESVGLESSQVRDLFAGIAEQVSSVTQRDGALHEPA